MSKSWQDDHGPALRPEEEVVETTSEPGLGGPSIEDVEEAVDAGKVTPEEASQLEAMTDEPEPPKAKSSSKAKSSKR